MFRRSMAALFISLCCSAAAHADLASLMRYPSYYMPDADQQRVFQNECGIRRMIENLGQVACFQEKFGRAIADMNPLAVYDGAHEWAQADLKTRRQLEQGFVEACTEARRSGDTYGADVGCVGLIKGILDVALKREADGSFPDDPLTNPAPAPEPVVAAAPVAAAPAKPAAAAPASPFDSVAEKRAPALVQLGTVKGQAFQLELDEPRKRDGELVIGKLLVNGGGKPDYSGGVAANCKQGTITDKYAPGQDHAGFTFNKPRSDVEGKAPKALCAG